MDMDHLKEKAFPSQNYKESLILATFYSASYHFFIYYKIKVGLFMKKYEEKKEVETKAF